MSETNETPNVADAAEQPVPAENAVNAVVDQAKADTDVEVKSDTPAEPEKPAKEPWFQKRIAELTREAAEAQRRAQVAESKITPASAAAAENAAPDIDKLIDQRAAAKAEQWAFNLQCNQLHAAGVAEFPDFDRVINTFKALGGLPVPLVEGALETGNAHKVLYALGKDPDEAQRIMSLSPARMGAALAKISAAPLPAPLPPIAVSKASAPVRPVSGGVVTADDPDKMSMTDWVKWRERQIAADKRA